MKVPPAKYILPQMIAHILKINYFIML
jgi:hypothetical protein